MTGYFSVQIQDLQGVYTAKTYWIAFAVVVGISSIGLVVFSALSGTMEVKIIYQSMSQAFVTASKAFISRKRKKSS